MVDPLGFEPRTNGLKVRCSTTELRVQSGGEGRIRTYSVSMCRIYSPVPVRRPSSFPKMVGDERFELPTLAV